MKDQIDGILLRSPLIEEKKVEVAALMSIPNDKFVQDLIAFRKKNVIDYFVEISPVQLPQTQGIVLQKGQEAVSLMISILIFFQEK